MTSRIVDRELQIDEDMVHVEFDKGRMETFVWLANCNELGYHYEFMENFFESMQEHAIKVKFDLYKEMIVPFIDGHSIEWKDGNVCNKDDEHLFIAMRNKLQKCLDAINSIQFR